MLRSSFVLAACNDMSLYQQDDAEGAFFRTLAQQRGATYVGDASTQGLYCLSASGKLLGLLFNQAPPGQTLAQLGQIRQAFAQLPASEVTPTAASLGTLTPDPRFLRVPPPDGLVLRVTTRRLEQRKRRLVASTRQLFRQGLLLPAQLQLDHAWLSHDECASLLPASLSAGASTTLPDALTLRLCRFHLIDTTYRGGDSWMPPEVLERNLTSRVAAVSPREVVLALQGQAQMQSSRDGGRYAFRIGGTLRYDRAKARFTAVDITATGAITSRTPRGQALTRWLGVSFERADGTRPGDDVPPHDMFLGNGDEACGPCSATRPRSAP